MALHIQLARISALSVLALLTACGGGGGSATSTMGGGAGNDIVADTPVEVAKPNSSLTRAMAENATGSAVLNENLRSGSSSVTIRSDLSILVKAASGAPDRYGKDQLQLDNDFLRIYTNSNKSEVLLVANSAAGASENTLEYTVFGAWLKSFQTAAAGSDNPSVIDMGSFVSGQLTKAENLPTTGSAMYTGEMVGFERGSIEGDGMVVSGLVAFEADFANREIDGSMRMSTAQGTTTSNIVMPTTAINGNGFSSNNLMRDNGDTGSLEGRFMGPNGKEIGGTFKLSGKHDVIGAFGAGVCTLSSCANTAFTE